MPHFVKMDINNGVITYTFSVAAASLAEFATFPLDLTKTRLQIQGEMAAKSAKVMPYRGMVKTCVGIAKEEGFFKLWSGITPAIWRHMIYSGSRMLFYEQLREKVFGKSADGSFKLWKSVCCGMLSGAMAQFLGNPADLVKVQMMMEGKRKLMGEQPRFKGATDALAIIWKQGKIRGLWKGAVPNVWRAALVNLGDLTTYDMAKERILKHTSLPDSVAVHFLSSVCAGFAGAVCATPADVIKSRVMNQPTDEKGRGLIYKSTYDCLKTTIKNESVFSLYKGFLPVWIRLGPWSLIFWLSYERLRKLSGAEQF